MGENRSGTGRSSNGSKRRRAWGGGAGGSWPSSMIIWLSHSPSVMPERRARSLAISRALGSIPFTLQGAPADIRIELPGTLSWTLTTDS